MALGDPYATLEQLKNYVQISDAVDDNELDDALNAASREIEQFCGRQFNDAGSVSARVFVPESAELAQVDDFHTTTGLVVEVDTSGDGSFASTWGASAYQVEPLNGVVGGMPGWPYYRLRTLDAEWPCIRQNFRRAGHRERRAMVRVTAQWGWAAVPDPVRQACLIVAGELFKLRSAPFGVAGFGEFGVVRIRANPKVDALLAPYVRYPAMVA